MAPPKDFAELTQAERRLLEAFTQIGYGRIEKIAVCDGQPVLDPWPRTVRIVKFGTQVAVPPRTEDYTLKKQVIDFIAQLRAIGSGVILVIEIQGGLPFTMMVEADQARGGVR